MFIGVLVDSCKHEYYGAKCRDCTQPMRVGHVAMIFDQGRGVYGGREIVIHRHCLEYALESAPLEQRDRVVA